jgi:hypothetical protein
MKENSDKWDGLDFLKGLKGHIDDKIADLYKYIPSDYKSDDEWDIFDKNNTSFRLSWNYMGWGGFTPENPYTQKDWNQTLMTKMNQLSAQIYQKSHRGGATHVLVHPKFRFLIDSLEYFNRETSKITNRFDVIFDKRVDENMIFVLNKKLIDSEIIMVSDTSTERGVETFLQTKDCTKEEIREYRKNLTGYIIIENYD